MEFPRYKEWMGEDDKLCKKYLQGVKEFVKYGQRNLKADIIPCPCTRCQNGKLHNSDTIELHLIKWGIVKSYIMWNFHGEREVPFMPEKYDNVQLQGDDDHLSHPRLNELINDSFAVHDLQHNERVDSNSEKNTKDCAESLPRGAPENDKEYVRLETEAGRPLYPNCEKDKTSLYAMVTLQNLKSRFCLSGNSVTEILKWAKDLLPQQNTMPDSYPSMKSSLKGLGMKYKSIHACRYDCILYRGEHENKVKCPICHEPRFTKKKDQTQERIKFASAPQKVLKYFPVSPRLKRLYTVSWISEAMTWHARAEEGGNLMRHPIDSTIWKDANIANPEFAKETRNVRLGLATDGFNPFGNFGTSKSLWPVIIVPYNLPPSLCNRKEFSMLALLIPGPKAPGKDIDVFLAPLIEELSSLWVEGVTAYDSFQKEEFTLRAMLLWAIHDFPAYGTLSGCNVHGYYACPVCGEETESEWLEGSKKICYHSHRRFLPEDHRFRMDKNNFIPNGIEQRPSPDRMSGLDTEINASNVEKQVVGKHPKNQTKNIVERRKSETDPNDPSKKKPWSRRSILFDLPYWKDHKVRHILDIMHALKNIGEHMVGTCVAATYSKDGVKAREDLQAMKIKRNLWLKKDTDNGKTLMPDGAFTLTTAERKVFLDTLFELKVPTGFSSNLRRVVNYATHDLKQCKSHDWHVIVQLFPLLFKHCFAKHKDLRRAIMQISLCLGLICEKVVNKKHIVAAKQTLVEATCVLEKYFPPAFFDISIHLLVHLCDEALLCGPVRYRWMFPFERLMKVFKDYVKNNRYIEGSIAEEYTTEEASLFAREYMPDPGIGGFGPCRERFIDDGDEFADEEALGNGKTIRLTPIQHEQASRYMFEMHESIDDWRQKYNDSGRNKRRKGESNTLGEFRLWVSNELSRLEDSSSRLARLATGPSFYAKEFGRYRVNGFVFSSYAREQNLVGKQDSGISIKAITTCVSSSKDKNPKVVELTYYGVVQQILELDYISFKEVVFYCDWVKVEDSNSCTVDVASKLVMVDLTKMKRKDNINDEPFVSTTQNIKQVFYSKYLNNGQWSVVLNSPKRLTTSADSLDAPTEFQSILDDNPNLCDFLDYLDP